MQRARTIARKMGTWKRKRGRFWVRGRYVEEEERGVEVEEGGGFEGDDAPDEGDHHFGLQIHQRHIIINHRSFCKIRE
jgi:hypothetical protein